MNMIVDILYILTDAIWWVILIQAVLSWLIAFNVINTYNRGVAQIAEALDRMTEPMYRPIRRILPDFGAIDVSPLVVLLLLSIVSRAVLPNLRALGY